MATKIWEVRVWHKVNTHGGIFKEGMTWSDYDFCDEAAARKFGQLMQEKGFKVGWRCFTI